MTWRLDRMVAEKRVGSFVVLVLAVVVTVGASLHRGVVAASPPIALDLTFETEAEDVAFSTMTDGELAAVMGAWCERARQRHPGSRVC